MIENYLQKLEAFCQSKNIDKYEIRSFQENNRVLKVYEQKVCEARDNASQSVALIVVQNGKRGRFDTTDFDEKKIPLVVEEALSNALSIDTDETFFLYDGKGDYPKVKPYKPLPQLAQLDKIDYLKTLEKVAYEADNRINKVIHTIYKEGYTRSLIRNSLGLKLEKEKNYAFASIYLSAKEGEVIKTDSEGVCFNKEEDFNPKSIIEKVVPRVVSRLDARDCKSQKCNVIFNHEVAGDLLAAFRNIFSSFNVDAGITKLKGKIGEKVALDIVTIVDNPLLDGGLATAAFDNEGVPTLYKELVKNGVLKKFVYGMALADKHKTQTTGNGSGGLYPIFFNLYIQNGNSSKEELLKHLGNGVYIDILNGLRVGCNVTSGEFSLGAEGFAVENGKLTKALNQFTIAGNIFDLLQNIEMLGDDLDLSKSSCAAPSLLVKNLVVSGV